MQSALDVLSQIRGFEHPDRLEPARGLSNRVFFLTTGGEEYVFRLANAHAEQLGISRQAEERALRVARQAGIGPDVVHYVQPQGHLLTRRIRGRPFADDPARYWEPETLRSIVRVVRRVHALPPLDHAFDPFARIRTSFSRAAERAVSLPAKSDRVLDRLAAIETARDPLAPQGRVFCHNDLFAGNILDAEPIRLIDWEFAGTGDAFFDLATLAVATDESTPLPRELRRVILDEYFGRVDPSYEKRLDDMIFVVRLHVVAWGLTHHVLGTPDSNGWPGFTFLGFATELLAGLISEP